MLATALCRIYARRGLRVSPFKAQNMALNSFVTREGGEMGRAQAVQAAAAGRTPTVEMNPVLLKPEGNACSQVILLGKPWKRLPAGEYYACRERLWSAVEDSFEKLAADSDLLIIEGAGSPAEINLKKHEIVNMRVAREFRCPVLLAGDIDRGGVFAALVGTMALLDEEERSLVRGFLINKFRGDLNLLTPGLEMLSGLTEGRPVVGVVPWLKNLAVAQEDSVWLEEQGVGEAASGVDIAVIKLPRITNYDDFDPLAIEEGVSLRFVERPEELGRPDAVILPGSKTVLKDLAWLRASGFDALLAAHVMNGGCVAGVGAGLMMMGRTIADPLGLEGEPSDAPGLGLLSHDTVLESADSSLVAGYTAGHGEGCGFLSGERFGIEGYMISPGRTTLVPGAREFARLEDGRVDGAVSAGGRVWGSSLHGLFEAGGFRSAWLRSLGWRGREAPLSFAQMRESAFDRLADEVEAGLNMPLLDRIIGL